MTSTTPSVKQRKRIGWQRWFSWILVIAGAASLYVGLQPAAIEVEAASVRRGPLTVFVIEEGKTRIRHRYRISAPVAGQLHRIPLRAGDKLISGETTLAVLEPLSAGLLDPRSRAEAEARVRLAEAGERRAKAELERQRAALELAQQQWRRVATLQQDQAISKWDAEAAQNQVVINERAVRAAEFGVQVAASELALAQATLEAGTPEGAGSRFGTQQPIKLVSPIHGVVLSVLEESARNVAAGTPLLELGDPADLEIEVELLSTDAMAVPSGAPVSIELRGGETPLRGRVAVVEPGAFTKVSSLGVEEQRVRVRVDFVNGPPSGSALGDRYRVETRIATWSQTDVLLIPTGALFRRGKDWMTFVVEGASVRARRVEVGHQDGSNAEVLAGLTEGQRVIMHPPDTLNEQSRVRLR